MLVLCVLFVLFVMFHRCLTPTNPLCLDTCFFTLDLVRYSSKEVLREKLTYAIRNVVSVDADNQEVDRSEWV